MTSLSPQASLPTKTIESVLVYNLMRTHGVLAPLLDSDLRSSRLTAAQFNALWVLNSTGNDSLTMGELGKHLVVSKSNVTGLVDRLERGGWAVRCPGADRRAIRVKITEAGRTLLSDVAPSHAKLLVELTGALTVEEKIELTRLLTKLRRALRVHRKEGA